METPCGSAKCLRFGQSLPSLRLIPKRPYFAPSKPNQETLAAVVEKEKLGPVEPLQVSETLAKVGRPSRETKPTDSQLLSEVTKPAEPTTKSIISETSFAFGAGLDQVPRWAGSKRTEIRPVPYIDINWRDQVEFSSVKGLIIDLIHGERWHGGLIGTLVWGRSARELAGLQVPTLKNTIQAGAYLEYALTPKVALGTRLRQDIQNTGVAYGEIYAELELPRIGYLEHDVRISQEAMNREGMRRFFGLTGQDAARLGVSEYNPKAGGSRTGLTYEGFLPTSESTGIAFSVNLSRLNGGASNSPLIRNFGSAFQKEIVAAFIYHF